jgi:hypothetical protein
VVRSRFAVSRRGKAVLRASAIAGKPHLAAPALFRSAFSIVLPFA